MYKFSINWNFSLQFYVNLNIPYDKWNSLYKKSKNDISKLFLAPDHTLLLSSNYDYSNTSHDNLTQPGLQKTTKFLSHDNSNSKYNEPKDKRDANFENHTRKVIYGQKNGVKKLQQKSSFKDETELPVSYSNPSYDLIKENENIPMFKQ